MRTKVDNAGWLSINNEIMAQEWYLVSSLHKQHWTRLDHGLSENKQTMNSALRWRPTIMCQMTWVPKFRISALLELPRQHGGSVAVDSILRMACVHMHFRLDSSYLRTQVLPKKVLVYEQTGNRNARLNVSLWLIIFLHEKPHCHWMVTYKGIGYDPSCRPIVHRCTTWDPRIPVNSSLLFSPPDFTTMFREQDLQPCWHISIKFPFLWM